MTDMRNANIAATVRHYKTAPKMEKKITLSDEIEEMEKKLGFDDRPYYPEYECAVVGPTHGFSAPGDADLRNSQK